VLPGATGKNTNKRNNFLNRCAVDLLPALLRLHTRRNSGVLVFSEHQQRQKIEFF